MKKLTDEEFRIRVESIGYKLLGHYINSRTKVTLECDNGHVYKVHANSFSRGIRCSVCSNKSKDHAEKSFIKLVRESGYTIKSEYKRALSKVELCCDKGHKFYKRPNDFNNGQRCPLCQGSSGQRMLQEMLYEFIDEEMLYNDRTTLGGLELDIFLPKRNIGIEYHGDYWHSIPEMKERDERKRKLCRDNGIKLMEVWESDFKKNPHDCVKTILNNI